MLNCGVTSNKLFSISVILWSVINTTVQKIHQIVSKHTKVCLRKKLNFHNGDNRVAFRALEGILMPRKNIY